MNIILTLHSYFVVLNFKRLRNKRPAILLPVCDLPSAPEDYDGHVDIITFWGAVATEMISHGFIACK